MTNILDDLIIPKLDTGDKIRIRHYRPDVIPPPPEGVSLHIYIESTSKIFRWKMRYENGLYGNMRIDTRHSGVEGLQEAINLLAENYAKTNIATQISKELTERKDLMPTITNKILFCYEKD